MGLYGLQMLYFLFATLNSVAVLESDRWPNLVVKELIDIAFVSIASWDLLRIV